MLIILCRVEPGGELTSYHPCDDLSSRSFKLGVDTLAFADLGGDLGDLGDLGDKLISSRSILQIMSKRNDEQMLWNYEKMRLSDVGRLLNVEKISWQ